MIWSFTVELYLYGYGFLSQINESNQMKDVKWEMKGSRPEFQSLLIPNFLMFKLRKMTFSFYRTQETCYHFENISWKYLNFVTRIRNQDSLNCKLSLYSRSVNIFAYHHSLLLQIEFFATPCELIFLQVWLSSGHRLVYIWLVPKPNETLKFNKRIHECN